MDFCKEEAAKYVNLPIAKKPKVVSFLFLSL